MLRLCMRDLEDFGLLGGKLNPGNSINMKMDR